MAWAPIQIYEGSSVVPANRRDVPYGVNTIGSMLDYGGGSSGEVPWSDDNDRRGWGRIDGSGFCYYELELLSPTSLRCYRVDELGDATTEDFTVAASASYDNIVHGCTITMAGSLTTGHKARVYPAGFTLDGGTYYVVRGGNGDSMAYCAYNPGDVTHKIASIRVGRGLTWENTSGTPMVAVHIGSDIILVDKYALTISAGTVSGKKFTFTGTGNTYIADNVANDATNVPFDDDVDTGLTFDAGSAPGNTDTAVVVVSDLANGMELAPDNSGVPGTWVVWNEATALSIPLNRAGYTDQSVPGAQTIAFWVRVNPSGSQALGRQVARMYPHSHKTEE
jgi:hypothetical protein